LSFENSRLIVCHSGKANTVVALVEHRVELANEDITQNPEGDVGHVGEGGHAVGHTVLGHLDDVILGCQGEDGAANVEVDIGQGCDPAAPYECLTTAIIRGAQLAVDPGVGRLGDHD